MQSVQSTGCSSAEKRNFGELPDNLIIFIFLPGLVILLNRFKTRQAVRQSTRTATVQP